MKGALLRIGRHENQVHLDDGGGDEDGSRSGNYAAAITKLIPGEVIAAYLTGKSLILAAPSSENSDANTWIAWTVFCLAMVIVIRRWMTSDKDAHVPPEWSAVIISALSFLVWIYSFGDVFRIILENWSKTSSGLVLIGWTLAAPAVLFGLKKLLRE